MATTPEAAAADRRVAIDMSVKLSAQLIATAVGVLAVLGAFTTYAWGARDLDWKFGGMALGAALALMASVVFAGKGISRARAAGFQGNWSLSEGKTEFNYQAWAGLIGLIFLLIAFLMFLFAPRRVDAFQSAGSATAAAIEHLAKELAGTREEIQRIHTDLLRVIAVRETNAAGSVSPDKATSLPTGQPHQDRR